MLPAIVDLNERHKGGSNSFLCRSLWPPHTQTQREIHHEEATSGVPYSGCSHCLRRSRLRRHNGCEDQGRVREGWRCLDGRHQEMRSSEDPVRTFQIAKAKKPWCKTRPRGSSSF